MSRLTKDDLQHEAERIPNAVARAAQALGYPDTATFLAAIEQGAITKEAFAKQRQAFAHLALPPTDREQ